MQWFKRRNEMSIAAAEMKVKEQYCVFPLMFCDQIYDADWTEAFSSILQAAPLGPFINDFHLSHRSTINARLELTSSAKTIS